MTTNIVPPLLIHDVDFRAFKLLAILKIAVSEIRIMMLLLLDGWCLAFEGWCLFIDLKPMSLEIASGLNSATRRVQEPGEALCVN